MIARDPEGASRDRYDLIVIGGGIHGAMLLLEAGQRGLRSLLVDLGDFSYADAAQILDIPIGTVMSRLHRGRRILKAQLAEEAVG